MANRFFTKINYSASNEDSESEQQALQLTSNDTVLCISGSGARSLDLLVDTPKKIVSIDFNPAQNYLLELKIAAYRALSYKAFARFIGLQPCGKRVATYQQLTPFLSAQAQAFWGKQPKHIKNGVLYCGTWERLLKNMLRLASPRKKLIEQLMAAPSLEVQRSIWAKKWDNWVWRLYLKIISNQFLWKYVVREPGARLIPTGFNVYDYMKARLDHMGNNFDLKTNHYAHLMLRGKYSPPCVLPHHLRPENFDLIKKNIHKIEIVTASLINYLAETPYQFNAFSLSDFSSYAPPEAYQHIWQRVARVAAPQARFCERQFLVKRNPETHCPTLKRNAWLEKRLNEKDEAYIYTFCVGVF
ncbi:DUF3419 family protein [uncultured Microscilla sp.]|uniref:DUF3419 family protein n=1 Tax=uncultured Microscilla sp. TaxID=432653 RepID=UPI0026048AFE|nr:DUF3419 family protein [uncultured Microscilla sp.]